MEAAWVGAVGTVALAEGAVRGVCSGAATTAVAAGGTAEKENRVE